MSDSPLTPPALPQPVGFFQNPRLPYVFARLGVYLIFTLVASFLCKAALQPFMGANFSPTAPRSLLAGEGIALAGMLSAAWLMSRLEHRRFGDYGLPLTPGMGSLFAEGAVFGLAEISAVLGALAAMGYYRFGPLAIHRGAVVRWALIWALIFLVVGFVEEFAFRGYVQFTLGKGIGFWPAALLLSFLFGGVHSENSGETLAGLAGVFITGIFWCFTLRRTGSLWFAVGMHASFDFGETFLYSVPDSGAIFPGHLSNATLAGPTWLSGGTAGPEASVFDFLMLLAFFFIFSRLHPAKSRVPSGGSTPNASLSAA
jgi:uncharacterized protein